MKSALECYQYAQHCERMAQEVVDQSRRSALLATAAQWRKLGQEAEHKEKGTIPAHFRKPQDQTPPAETKP